ncbi:hypothetical protein AAF712_014782, partial [Marasmius tenuissimus]
LSDLGGLNPFEPDTAFIAVSHLVSLPGLLRVELSVGTFIDLVTTFPGVDRSFSPTLTELRIKAISSEAVDRTLSSTKRVARLIRNALLPCSPELLYFHLRTNLSVMIPDEPLVFPKLLEYIGPHDFLRGLRFASCLKILWVPADFQTRSIPWMLTRSFIDDRSSLDLTSLSVLRWSKSDTRLEDLFSMFPNLKQLALELPGPVPKAKLLQLCDPLTKALSLTAITVLSSSKKDRVSRKEQEEVVAAWMHACPSLTSIRFDRHLKYCRDPLSSEWDTLFRDPEEVSIPVTVHRTM